MSKHNVSADEAEWVVDHAKPPYPKPTSEEKYIVRGQTKAGRYLQVIFAYHSTDMIDPDGLSVEELAGLQDHDELMYVIHARDLKSHEKRSLHRRRK